MSELKPLLKELQSTDLELHALTTERDAIPQKIAALEQELNLLNRRLEEAKQTLTDSRTELKLAELNLTSQEETLVKYNSQLFSAKTNEEYKAFLREIETTERKKNEIEDGIITLMERIEQEEAELAKRKAEKEREESKKKQEIQAVKASQSHLEATIEEVREKYERLRRELPDNILAIYDRIKKNKHGLAVAQILDANRCSGCLNPIPTQQAIEAAHSEELVFCEYCGRILLV